MLGVQFLIPIVNLFKSPTIQYSDCSSPNVAVNTGDGCIITGWGGEGCFGDGFGDGCIDEGLGDGGFGDGCFGDGCFGEERLAFLCDFFLPCFYRWGLGSFVLASCGDLFVG